MNVNTLERKAMDLAASAISGANVADMWIKEPPVRFTNWRAYELKSLAQTRKEVSEFLDNQLKPHISTGMTYSEDPRRLNSIIVLRNAREVLDGAVARLEAECQRAES